ncbi:MAG: class I SAM-dependent methyltransferase family protein [Candidatus Bathyarchaeota archaeon]|nr:MAG: class I SAM-dependent methyltransferase family protein [Candidatus Bathyarchaeota archaeon]
MGERTILLVRRLNLLNLELRVQNVGDDLYVPLTSVPLPSEIEKLKSSLPEFEVSAYRFARRTKRSLKFVDVLGEELPPHLVATLPNAMDFVGDVAVIEIPPELEAYKQTVGEAVLKIHKRVRLVLAKSSAVEGVYRLREFETIAGVGRPETIHKEYGCMYHVDLAKVYFSPRLSREHDRVASQIKDGETVVDMFASVGPFSILIAKRHKNVQVHAVDVNPIAVSYLKKNIEANHVGKNIVPLSGDIRQVVEERLAGVADRVIMNLPEKAKEYMDTASKALKPEGGTMHYYEFTGMPKPLKTAKIRLVEAVKQTGRNVKRVSYVGLVRATAPYTFQVVVDAEIQ